MQGWQYVADGEPISLNDVPEPELGPGTVILDVKATGICHTDVGFLDGTVSSQLAFSPITLGHEVAGVVSAVADDVSGLAVGDRVAVLALPTGPGTASHGGFQPRIAVESKILVPIPDGVGWDQAAVSTDAGATSQHAVVSRGRAQKGDRVGVIGLGGLGSLAAQIAVGLGAEVYVADTDESLFDYAREIGVAGVSTDLRDFRDVGIDLVCDFAGFGTTTAAAVEVVKEHGRVVVVGLARRYGTLDLIRLTLQQLEVVGSVGGTVEDNAQVLTAMAEGRLVSRTTAVAFDEIGESIRRLERGGVAGRLVVLYD